MGLGLLGRGVGDAAFLAECGAEVIVTDMKSEQDLLPSVEKLRHFPNIKFVLGEHRLEDFRARDFILKAAGVPLDSPYLAEARKRGIPIEMDASLFAEFAPKEVILIGVTGTRGKSTVTALIYEMLRTAGKDVFLAGNIRGTATLPLLARVRPGDYVVLELDSWQLQGFGEARLSPHVAVFTTFFPDHMNYYGGSMEKYFADKENIFKYQKAGDILVVGEQAAARVAAARPAITPIIARWSDVAADWSLRIPGRHNRENISCAVNVGRALKIPARTIRVAATHFGGVTGRLEFVRDVRGISIYNDTNATSPEATIAALNALSAMPRLRSPHSKPIILIMGGADKELDMSGLLSEIPRTCRAVIALSGTGTAKLRSEWPKVKTAAPGLKISEAANLKDAVSEALAVADTGDIILFSPAFASFGMFKNEYDRGEQLLSIVRSL